MFLSRKERERWRGELDEGKMKGSKSERLSFLHFHVFLSLSPHFNIHSFHFTFSSLFTLVPCFLFTNAGPSRRDCRNATLSDSLSSIQEAKQTNSKEEHAFLASLSLPNSYNSTNFPTFKNS